MESHCPEVATVCGFNITKLQW